jgi:hypothetical protein
MTDTDHDGANQPSVRQDETEKQKTEAWARERQKMLCRFYEEINRPEGPSDEMRAWWWAQY